VQGTQPKPIGGLTEAIFEEVQDNQQNLPLDRLLTLLMSSPDATLLAKRLSLLNDPWPIPKQIDYAAWQPDHDEYTLSPEDRRTLRAFDQIVFDNRKSTKYAHQFADLQSRYSHIEFFAQLLCNYYFAWNPLEDAREFANQLLSQHPGWLLIRLQVARSYLKESDLNFAGFETAMNHCLNLDQHLEQLSSPLNDLLVYQYHIDLFLYFAFTGHLMRAAYCFNVAHKSASNPEGLVSLAPLILASVDPESGTQAFRELVKFLKV
jgi:hypothetical protein